MSCSVERITGVAKTPCRMRRNHRSLQNFIEDRDLSNTSHFMCADIKGCIRLNFAIMAMAALGSVGLIKLTTRVGVRVKLSEGWNGENNHYRKRELHEFHRASCK